MNVSEWTLALAGVENFVLLCAALSVLSFIATASIRANRKSRDWHPLRLSRVYAAALVVPPLVSAWLVLASLLPVLWLGQNRWAGEHEKAH
jgi:hypothetical protein